MNNDGYLYISDVQKQEVRRWKRGETNGIVVAGGNKRSHRFDQVNQPYYVFVE